ncbi:MAG: histidine kinase N-terminal 7TM domain-containing protein [Cyclobacteriaceae bacterium]
MGLHFNVYAITLLMSGTVAFLLSLILFQRKNKAVQCFAMMMFCIAIWAIAYAIELASTQLEQMLFWIKVEYIGITFMPATWITFVIRHTGNSAWLSVKNIVLIFIFPIIGLLLVWSNQYHHLHYTHVSVDSSGPFPLLAIVPGPWYMVHTAYFYFLLAWGLFLLIKQHKQSSVLFKKQNQIFIFGVIIPWIVNFIYLLGIRPHQHIDLTPYSFIATSLLISYGLLKYQFLDILPLARLKILEGIREGFMVLDTDMRIVEANYTMEKFVVGNSSNFVGKPISEVFHRDYKFINLIGRQKNEKIELDLDTSHGIKTFEVAISSIYDNNIFCGTLLLFWDVTERKKAGENLKKVNEELQTLNQLKLRIFSIIAHDLRSPLANLVGLINFADTGDIAGSDIKKYLPSLSKNIGDTSLLLDDLFNWARSQMDGEKINMELVDLRVAANGILRMFESKILEKQIRLENELGYEVKVYADQSMLAFILRNLIANAIKFCREGDTISLTANQQGDDTLICIRDTGVGMDQNTLQKLFSNEIISKTGTKKEKGTGLGLKLCKDFAQKNQGKIWAESEYGKGSSFYFTLKSNAGQINVQAS